MTTMKVDLLEKPGRKMGFDPIVIFLVLVIVVFVVFFIFWGKHYDERIDAKKQEISEIDKKIRDLEGKIPEIQRQEKENQELEAQINAIKQLVYDPIRYRNLLDEIALVMPKNIFINNLNIEPGNRTISFSGVSVEVGGDAPLNSISVFMQNIEKSPLFEGAPNMPGTSRTTFEDRTAYGFQMDARYNPDNAAKQAVP